MEMKIAQKITWLLMFLMVTACSTTSTTMVVDPNASAQVKIDETQVMLILGGSDGKGLLDMKGEVHAFKIAGVKLGGMGIDEMHMTGNVYNLNKLEDFAGTYFEADAAATVVKGAGGTWMKNSKGVSIHLKGSSDGLSLGLGVEGVEISML
jgi:hypothetical protein